MRFEEMCLNLFDREYLMAYRKGWPEIMTYVRVTEDKKGNQVLAYFNLDQPQVPVIITKEVIDNDDWVCTNEITDRFCIKSFMTMPKAKEFMQSVQDFLNSSRAVVPEEFHTNEYRLRMNEAVALRLLYPDANQGRMVLTDFGLDLLKMWD